MRVLVIVNDRSGGGDSGLYDFIRFLGIEGVEVVLRYLTAEKTVEDLTHDAPDYDRIVAAGGDGTVSAVCYATRETGVPVLVYPAGTANLLAQNLGMPTDPPPLSEILLSGVPVGFDLGELERSEAGMAICQGFAIMAGCGYDAAVMKGAANLKPALGAAAYLVSAVTNLAPRAADFELVLDGRTVHETGIGVLIANFARIQFDLPVTPGSDPTDGRLEVAVLKTKTAVGLLPVVTAAVLDRIGDNPDRTSNFALYSASQVGVRATPRLRMQFDGEALDAETPFTARVLPRAATLLVAPSSPFARRTGAETLTAASPADTAPAPSA